MKGFTMDSCELAFAVLEGGCVECEGDSKLVRVGGSPAWLRDNTFMGEHEIDEWLPSAGYTGAVTCVCESCKIEYYAEQGESGDWYANCQRIH